jgi:hypothetical protein
MARAYPAPTDGGNVTALGPPASDADEDAAA